MLTVQSPVVAEFNRTLSRHGVVAGLAFLNRRVTHRCTAIYRLEAMTVRNVYLYDRDGTLLPQVLGVVPLNDSFCQHAMREGAFRSDDTRSDARVDGSPFKGVVLAYHGVPVLDVAGELYGTLCHFDFEPHPLSDEEFEIMQDAALLLPPYL